MCLCVCVLYVSLGLSRICYRLWVHSQIYNPPVKILILKLLNDIQKQMDPTTAAGSIFYTSISNDWLHYVKQEPGVGMLNPFKFWKKH